MKRSLQFRLSVWLAVLVAAVAAIAGIIAFKTAFEEANELQDGQLKQIATLITERSLPVIERAALANVPGADHELRLVVQVIGEQAPLALSANLPDGIQNTTVDGTPWRLFVKTLNPATRVVVAQATAGRDEIARNSALATVMPLAILVPVLILILGMLVRRMFKPLAALSTGLDRRAEHDLSQLSDTSLPTEIVPFVVAINRLFARVAQSIAMQRHFIANAAHELRSPLTALSLQAERLETSEMSMQARERLAAMRRGIGRTRTLLEQLLTLARAQEWPEIEATSILMQVVFRHVLEELMPLAQAKHIDLGVTGTDDILVVAPQVELQILVKNLVDNAIRYTPQHGRIDLSVSEINDRVQLVVEDTGPGIASEERARVFDPFYRVPGNEEHGSGLGLSIVATIAARIGGDVDLTNIEPHGLRVTVTLARP